MAAAEIFFRKMKFFLGTFRLIKVVQINIFT